MIDHVSVRVQDFPRAIAFYKAALAPLGYELLMQFPGVAGFGANGKPDLWIHGSDKPTNPTHVAVSAPRPSVEAFHAAALAAGGTDNGSPGLRPDYHPHYYGAFILDPEGNNVEAVCHDAPGAASRAAPAKKRSNPAPPRPPSAKKKPAAKKAPAKKRSAKKRR